MLISLESAAQGNLSEEVGAKARTLGQMLCDGLPVPAGYVLLRSQLRRLVEENGRLEEFESLLSSETVLHRYHKLRKLILELRFSHEEEKRLRELLHQLGGVVAVRSSAPDEDTQGRSMAGMYNSFTGVTSPDEMMTSILECYASAFSEGVFHLGTSFGAGTAVIIQTYIAFDLGGVAFSCDPVTRSRDHVLLNFAAGGIEKVVAGEIDGALVRVPKQAEPPLVAGLSPSLTQELTATVCRLEELFGRPVDVEWGVADGALWVVQARPVTFALSDQTDAAPRYINTDDLQACTGVDLGPLQEIHLKALEKRHHLRALCLRKGIHVAARRYLVAPHGVSAAWAAERLQADMRTEFVEVFDGQEYTIVRTADLPVVCGSLCGNGQVPVHMMVQEYHFTRTCGYASQTADGACYVETLPGTFGGFWLERLRPTVYRLDGQGRVLDVTVSEVSEHMAFFPETGKYGLVQLDAPLRHTLAPEACAQIVDLVNKLSSELGEVRVEWVSDGASVYLFDVSEESRSLVESTACGHVLSAGYAEGPVCLMEDVTALDSLFPDELTIDVVPNRSFLRLMETEECQTLVRSTLGGLERPVLVAEYPKRPLAILADHVAGFIFESGALLSHLAIILREKGVPAVVMPQARALLQHGERIQLVEGRVITGRDLERACDGVSGAPGDHR